MLTSLSVEKEFSVKRKFNIGVISRVPKLTLSDDDGIHFAQNVTRKAKLTFNVRYVTVTISVLVMGTSPPAVIDTGSPFNLATNSIN